MDSSSNDGGRARGTAARGPAPSDAGATAGGDAVHRRASAANRRRLQLSEEERRARRRQANRDSARRMRIKKVETIEQLQHDLAAAQGYCDRLTADNARLRRLLALADAGAAAAPRAAGGAGDWLAGRAAEVAPALAGAPTAAPGLLMGPALCSAAQVGVAAHGHAAPATPTASALGAAPLQHVFDPADGPCNAAGAAVVRAQQQQQPLLPQLPLGATAPAAPLAEHGALASAALPGLPSPWEPQGVVPLARGPSLGRSGSNAAAAAPAALAPPSLGGKRVLGCASAAAAVASPKRAAVSGGACSSQHNSSGSAARCSPATAAAALYPLLACGESRPPLAAGACAGAAAAASPVSESRGGGGCGSEGDHGGEDSGLVTVQIMEWPGDNGAACAASAYTAVPLPDAVAAAQPSCLAASTAAGSRQLSAGCGVASASVAAPAAEPADDLDFLLAECLRGAAGDGVGGCGAAAAAPLACGAGDPEDAWAMRVAGAWPRHARGF
ncbi:MAG: hypothetical protein J3K34DRAFT_522888 [Monoraphidium minutum]|nr:MAG: hypothetical protein J3K34DRAFT_522888 [Monoraphidium minutum]